MTYNVAIQSLIDIMPARIRRLPVSAAGFPIPRFVKWIGGVPDFRVIDPIHLAVCIRLRCCWICGDKLGRNMAFVVGPLAAINRTNSEPPSHLDCATYATHACPFLASPRMRQNEVDLPDNIVPVAGLPIKRNPGVHGLWIVRDYTTYRPPSGGVMFDIGEPEQVSWFAERRPATRAQIDASIDAVIDTVIAIAAAEGPDALADLRRCTMAAERYLPPHETTTALRPSGGSP